MKLSDVPPIFYNIWRKQYEEYCKYVENPPSWKEWLKDKYEVEE